MAKRWLGIVVSSDRVNLVLADVDGAPPIVIQADDTWSLQQGDRAKAYHIIHQRISDYARENNLEQAVMKGSAVSLRGTKKVHLEAAELRGVVMSALAGVTNVVTVTKANISRNFGTRKVDEYLADESFWAKKATGGNLRIGSREAAMVILAALK